MAQVITLAGEKLFATKAQENQQLDIDTFIFANVAGQDPAAAIDRNEGIPTSAIVHQQNVQQTGRINDNVVVYSTVLDSVTGPFEFNWVGLYSSVNQTLVAISHVPTVSKTITAPGSAGNTLNRNFGIEYSGIADLAGISVSPETWQLDFSARLSGMDELTRQLASDMNGKDWFIDDGFKVVPRSTANTFSVTPGVGYVSGLRVELKQEHILTLQTYPQFVYVDAYFDGNASSQWKPQVDFTVSKTEMDDYIDTNGIQHYVCKLTSVESSAAANDLRNAPALNQQIKNHEESENAHNASSIKFNNKNLEQQLSSMLRVQKQPSMVDKMLQIGSPTFNYLRAEGGALFVGMLFGADIKKSDFLTKRSIVTGCEWRFKRDGDGLYLVRGGYSGDADIIYNWNSDVNLNGSFSISSYPNVFTTSGGDTFTGTFTGGSTMFFKHYSDNRGGVWEFTVEGVVNNVSTYSSDAQVRVDEVMTGLDASKTYTYTAKFIGDDPLNAPSTGSGTSRGWVFYDPNNTEQKPMLGIEFNGLKNVKTLSAEGSINDFALSVRPNGSNESYTWVPRHSTPNASTSIATKIFIDGEFAYDNANYPTDFGIREIKDFSIQSRFIAKNGNDSVSHLWLHFITHSVENGVLSINNKLEFLKDTQLSGYLALIGADTRDLTRVVYSAGKEFPTSNDSSDAFGFDATSGVMYAGTFDFGRGIYHGIGCDVDIYSSCLIGTELEPDLVNLQTFRSDNVCKTYWKIGSGVAYAGDVMKSNARHYMINGVRFPNVNIRSI